MHIELAEPSEAKLRQSNDLVITLSKAADRDIALEQPKRGKPVLRDGSNQRSGPYGGSVENRARLMLDVIAAASSVWGGERVALRISPLNSYNSMIDSDPIGVSCDYLAGAFGGGVRPGALAGIDGGRFCEDKMKAQ